MYRGKASPDRPHTLAQPPHSLVAGRLVGPGLARQPQTGKASHCHTGLSVSCWSFPASLPHPTHPPSGQVEEVWEGWGRWMIMRRDEIKYAGGLAIMFGNISIILQQDVWRWDAISNQLHYTHRKIYLPSLCNKWKSIYNTLDVGRITPVGQFRS